MSSLNIKTFDFGELGAGAYVMISVAVGENPNPTYVTRRIRQFEGTSKLCNLLRSLGIEFDIVPTLIKHFSNDEEEMVSINVINKNSNPPEISEIEALASYQPFIPEEETDSDKIDRITKETLTTKFITD